MIGCRRNRRVKAEKKTEKKNENDGTIFFVVVADDDGAEGEEGDGRPVQEGAEAVGEGADQSQQDQAGLPQRLQERAQRRQPGAQRRRRQRPLARTGETTTLFHPSVLPSSSFSILSSASSGRIEPH